MEGQQTRWSWSPTSNGTPAALAALKAAGDDWHAEAIAQVCEAVSAILLDLRPRAGSRLRPRR